MAEGGGDAIRAFEQLQRIGKNTEISITVAALKVCIAAQDLRTGRRIHACIRAAPSSCGNIIVANTLIHMYAKCGSLAEARRVFDGIRRPSIVSWNAIIFGYAESHDRAFAAVELFQRMHDEGLKPNALTYVAALKACSSCAVKSSSIVARDGSRSKTQWLEIGLAIHSLAARNGFELQVYVASTLVDFYCKCGRVDDARRVFDRMPDRSIVSWNAVIFGHVEVGEPEVALDLFCRIEHNGDRPNPLTYVAALKACATGAEKDDDNEDGKSSKLKWLEIGMALHRRALTENHEDDDLVANTLLHMYATCGSIEDACRVFQKIRRPSVVSWSAMILGYVENGEPGLALALFSRMQEDQTCKPNASTYMAALRACGSLVALEEGRKIHSRIRDDGLEDDAVLATCLVDFYGKCGSTAESEQVFWKIRAKDVVSWSALLAGYSKQGDVTQVFRLYEEMLRSRVQPDGIVFQSILNVCNHTGLVDVAKDCFHAMRTQFGITPSLEHCTCLVDLLGRENCLEEAVNVLVSMPWKPDVTIWMTVLKSCRKWKNLKLATLAFESVLKIDDKYAGAYVTMSNIYSSLGMLEESLRVEYLRKGWLTEKLVR